MNYPEDIRRAYGGIVDRQTDSVRILAPAKINLFLKVIERRPDGYHDIFSWFQAIDLHDELHVKRTDSPVIELTTDCPAVPTGPDNLVCKAAKLLQQKYQLTCGFNVDLKKNIPVGAGLGGGSSDVAAFIKAANLLLDIGLTRQEMEVCGLEIGSDVPFFFGTGQAEVTGRGEIVKDIILPVGYRILLVTPPFEIRAAEAYQRLKLDLTEPFKDIKFTCSPKTGELFGVVSSLANDLETALVEAYPVLREIKRRLAQTWARAIRISGSGPTVYALYDKSDPVGEEFVESFVGEGWGCRFASPLILPH